MRNPSHFMNKAREAEIRVEVEQLRSLDKDALRVRWSKVFGKMPPPALTKDLLGRMIAWRIQERFYGGPSCSMVWHVGRPSRSRPALGSSRAPS